MARCKHQTIKIDKDGYLIYKCELNTEPNEDVFIIKKHFEKQFPEKIFGIHSGYCFYIGYEDDCPCFK